MAIFFIGATMAVVERLKPAGSTKSYLLYKRGSNAQPKDAEDQISKSPSSGRSERTAISDDMKTGKTTLSWRKLNYHVNGLHLLKDVEGFVRPGELCALSEQKLIKNCHVLIVISRSGSQWCCTRISLSDLQQPAYLSCILRAKLHSVGCVQISLLHLLIRAHSGLLGNAQRYWRIERRNLSQWQRTPHLLSANNRYVCVCAMLRLLLIDGQATVNKWTCTSRKLLSGKLWNSLRF